MRRAGSTRAGAEEPVQEPDEFRRRYRNAIDTDMAAFTMKNIARRRRGLRK
jgi:hypothetical protein